MSEETVGLRLQGYRLGNPSYFCPECWEDRPEDFDGAGCQPLSRVQAHGQVCDICERALVGGEE